MTIREQEVRLNVQGRHGPACTALVVADGEGLTPTMAKYARDMAFGDLPHGAVVRMPGVDYAYSVSAAGNVRKIK